MKKYQVSIKIMLKRGILDVQGKTVENSLHSIGFESMQNVRIGKYVQLEIQAESIEQANELVKSACDKLIANPIIEDYDIQIEEVK
ncbi:MAG TPA: phosphoribosylformylglycinamidine synthase subunit PurS [Bacteroidota bacterium]|nr:phosphoribosylformylglycinamidine synthase subunit PurS [Bacteroidota bacterium]HRT67560.1 phosphoribosylformylglycinamidine synthase subunit PurS [Bacteroidota bacterium]